MIPILLLLIQDHEDMKRMAKVQQEIQIINLINGLELTQYQIGFILAKAKEAEQIKEGFYESGDRLSMILNELRENRIEDKVITDGLRKKVYGTENQLYEQRTNMEISLKALAKEIEAILDGHQIYALESYVPCLIPPEGGSRIGQSEKPLGMTNRLARIRQIPDWIYATRKYEIADRAVTKIKEHLPPGTIFNEHIEQQRILVILDEVRDLSDVDFVLREDEYAAKIRGDYFPERIPEDPSLKIERFLLNPLIVPILEQRIVDRSLTSH
jgi:hypothetical protein